MAAIDGFMFFRSYYEAIQSLPRAADRCALYDALCAYAFLDQPPQLSARLMGLWNLMVPNLDRSISRAVANKRRKAKLTAEQGPQTWTQNGSASCGTPAPEGSQIGSKPVPKGSQIGSNPVPNLRQTGEEEEKKEKGETEAEKKEKGAGNGAGMTVSDGPRPHGAPTPFVPPSVEMVREYCQAQGLGVDPVRFVSYYEACGWMMGRNPMKSWQAALRAWEAKEPQQSSRGFSGSGSRSMPQEYTLGKSELAAIEKLRQQGGRLTLGE